MDPCREAYVRFLRDHWEIVQARTITNAAVRWATMDVEEVVKRVREAGAKYGPFDVHSIDVFGEREAEHLDTPAYEAMILYRDELDAARSER